MKKILILIGIVSLCLSTCSCKKEVLQVTNVAYVVTLAKIPKDTNRFCGLPIKDSTVTVVINKLNPNMRDLNGLIGTVYVYKTDNEYKYYWMYKKILSNEY